MATSAMIHHQLEVVDIGDQRRLPGDHGVERGAAAAVVGFHICAIAGAWSR
jgi:hypothetical protein